MRQLRCFIASAFGKNDTDITFTKVIQPVLLQRNIAVQRVDRIEHNDDIDDKIRELIEDCDFCIADLTYARPSVYYEAGRVHGMEKPVIFLARSDHFKRRNDDSYGNFRIHFDLQMKNIIQWTVPTAALQKRLGSRVDIVTKPLLKMLREDETNKEAQASFSMLPQQEKLYTIVELVASGLKKMRFHLEKEEKGLPWRSTNLLAIKKLHNVSILVWFMAQASFNKSRLVDIGTIRPETSHSISDFIKSNKIDIEKNITLHTICCSLRATPTSRIADALPHFCPHEQFKVYSYIQAKKRYTFFDNRHIHFLENIDSVLVLQEQMKKHLSLIGALGNEVKGGGSL